MTTENRGDAHVSRLDWQLLHLIYRIYWEGVHSYATGVYQYADPVRLVPQLDDRLAGELIDPPRRYCLEAAGHYVLRRLGTHLISTLPPALVQFIEESRTPPQGVYPLDVNDLGDIWPKLWGRR